MIRTTTGSFPIGFRVGSSAWQKDLPAVCRFAIENEFAFLDLGPESPNTVKQVLATGLKIGSVDLLRPWDLLASSDSSLRKNAVEIAADHVKSCAALGVQNFFAVVFPDDPLRKRSESFALAADGFAQLCRAIDGSGARIVIEGYPGSPPHYSALVYTPEAYRAFFPAVGSNLLGINYDPSHLIKMGIDPLRFVDEFASRIFHVHAKDTQLLPEGLYEFGNLQPALHAAPHKYGGHHWRYTLPGKGQAPWPALMHKLKGVGYKGGLGIELEDEQYNGTEPTEKRGLLESLAFLVGT